MFYQRFTIVTNMYLCFPKIHHHMILHEQILKDKNGNSIGVFLPMADYEALMKVMRKMEDIEDIRDFDLIKSSDDEIIPIEQAFNEIEAERDDL